MHRPFNQVETDYANTEQITNCQTENSNPGRVPIKIKLLRKDRYDAKEGIQKVITDPETIYEKIKQQKDAALLNKQQPLIGKKEKVDFDSRIAKCSDPSFIDSLISKCKAFNSSSNVGRRSDQGITSGQGFPRG